MAKLVTAYQTTDGEIWLTQLEADAHQAGIDKTGRNSLYREAFNKALKSVPKYGKLVGESASTFSRSAGRLNAMGVYSDLLKSYTSQFATAMDAYIKETGAGK